MNTQHELTVLNSKIMSCITVAELAPLVARKKELEEQLKTK